MNTKLSNLKIGDTAIICGYEKADPKYREKLLSMGLTKGTTVKLTKHAPLGDPVELEIRNFKLSLRKEEAEILILQNENENTNQNREGDKR